MFFEEHCPEDINDCAPEYNLGQKNEEERGNYKESKVIVM